MRNLENRWSALPFFLVVPLALLVLLLPLVVKGENSDLTPTVFLPIMQGGLGNEIPYPIVFVSRQIPEQGSVYWDEPNGMPGVGPYSRFQVAAPGKLVVLETDGSVRVLVDGENPSLASMNLVDVNAPDVSYDGTKIVFAGIPAGNYDPRPAQNPGAWRIYTIDVTGTNLQQVTFSDQNLDLTQFGGMAGALAAYDDTDPVWLPDGRIVFSSTRFPSTGQYGGVRTSNLHVVNPDGSGLERITSERNGADRPIVDPITGKIVYARWWRNHRFATDSMDTILHPDGGYIQHEGLTMDRSNHVGGYDNLWRNFWQIASINPDGTELEMWGGTFRNQEANHAYGGAFTPDGEFIANFFPMYNMTEAAGFGGLRRYSRGPGTYEALAGITYLTLDYVHPENPTSYGIFNGTYAAEPEALPDGRIVFSWTPDIYQDYDLYLLDADGENQILVYDHAGTTELRARAIRERPLPPIIPDTITQVASLLPPLAEGPYDRDGTFVFDALNVYFNAPVDVPIINAPPVGSASVIRFFIDHQRNQPATFPYLEWPILLAELPVSAAGAVRNEYSPANVPVFEQIRSADGTVPLTMGPFSRNGDGTIRINGAAHVAGINFGRPGAVQRCVGCHAGHTMIPVPENPADARWTNLATGATVAVSSSRDPAKNINLIDRRVQLDSIYNLWTSAPNQTENQWITLTFPVPVVVRTVRLYGPRQGGGTNSSLAVHAATIRLYDDVGATNEVASASIGEVAVSGTDVQFADIVVRVIRVQIDSASGTFDGLHVVGLSEIEVIASGLVPQ
jgi:hypothetical protein